MGVYNYCFRWEIHFHLLFVVGREGEVRQLILVQSSQISASIYLFVYLCVCVALRNARSSSFSARAYSWNECHPYNIRRHELLFILIDFMVQIDYWLHDECTYQADRYYAQQYALSIVTPTARARTAFKYALLLLSVARQLILMTAVRIWASVCMYTYICVHFRQAL